MLHRILMTLHAVALLFWLIGTPLPSPAAAGNIPEIAESPLPSFSQPFIPYLGTHPELPAQAARLSGVDRKATTQQTTGFTVDITSREQSRNFYNAIYPASENVPSAGTGDPASCSAGTTSDAFKTAVQLRVNYFRAMAGVPAAITFNSTYSAKNQQAALMMSSNNTLSHSPPSSWSCYTADGAEAAGQSNLALGLNGADAITGYVLDHGANNYIAGHRRWLLYPQTQVMGTGDIPATSSYLAANALWVFDGNYGSTRPITRDEFVAWPPPGYVPYQVVFPRWSFSYPGADFSAATVTMTRNGVNIPVNLEPIAKNIGENTLVWVPDNLDTNSPDSFPRPVADTLYTVAVNNVKIGATTRNFPYDVKIFDPQTPGVDHVSAAVSGSTSLTVGTAYPYDVTPVPGADSYQWSYTKLSQLIDSYDAENGLSGITATVSSGYSPLSTDIRASGFVSYHMVHPGSATNLTNQILTLNSTFLAGQSSTLTFRSRLGWATSYQTAVVEVSTDDGATWTHIFDQAGSNGAGEMTFTTRTLDLSAYAERAIRLRFAYLYVAGQSIYPQTDSGVGWYLDDIAFTDTMTITGTSTASTIPNPSFTFTPPAVGNYILQARPLLYGQYPLEWGPVSRVTAVAPSRLSLLFSGAGKGTVTAKSDLDVISCTKECAKLFATGKPVLLMATPDANSLFGSWSGGGCGGAGNCSVPMTADTTVTAQFDYVQPVRVPLAALVTDYSSLTLGYGAVPDGGSILARSFIFSEDLQLNENKRVILWGGYDTGFASTTGVSVLNGRLTVVNGSLVVAGLVIK